jgi:hypothetical protein
MFILTLFLFATLARAIYITLPVNGTSPVYVVGSNVTISWTVSTLKLDLVKDAWRGTPILMTTTVHPR